MSTFIASLESRTLLSALPITKATMVADRATIAADAAALKANLAILVKADTVETAAIAKDFKGLPKVDFTLLKTLETDENKGKGLLTKDVAAFNAGKTLTAKSTSIGISLLTKATVKSLLAATVDITALESVIAVPLATLDAQLADTTIPSDRAAILAAFPSDAALDAAVELQITNSTTEKAAIGAAAAQYSADIDNLIGDLTSIHTAVGSFPQIVETFTGTAHETAGVDRGQTAAVTLSITSEDADGLLAGTVSDFAGGSDPLIGSVSLNGVIALKSSPGTGKVKIGGTLDGDAITGVFAFSNGHGTFSVVAVVP